MIVAFSAQAVFGQSATTRDAQVTTPVKPSAAYGAKVIAQIQFSNVSLKDALYVSRDEFEGVQFVTSGPVERWTIDIELRSVNLRNMLKAIEIQLEGQVKIKEEEDNMIAVYAHLPAAPKPVLRAFSIGPFMETKLIEAAESHGKNLESEELEKLKEEVLHHAENEIHETVYRSLEMLSEAREASDHPGIPQLNIHPRTQLMIAVGSPEAVEVVGQIVSALNGHVQAVSSYGAGGGGGVMMGIGGCSVGSQIGFLWVLINSSEVDSQRAPRIRILTDSEFEEMIQGYPLAIIHQDGQNHYLLLERSDVH